MQRSLFALIALLLAGLTPSSAAACKIAGWAPIPRTPGISYFVATTSKGTLPASAVQAELIIGRTDSVVMPTGAAILVPYHYDGLCRTVPWDTLQNSHWSPPESAAFYTGWLRPRGQWINGLPTIDIRLAEGQPAWRGEGEIERVLSGSTTRPLLTPREFFDLYSVLPTDAEAREKRPQALQRVDVWESAHPGIATHGLVRSILDGVRRMFADTARAAASAQQAAAETITQWGEITDSLQLSITAGKNTGSLTEAQSFLYLTVQIRNISNAPVSVDFDYATYDFEYEIDGTWYAFERLDPLPDPLSLMRSDSSFMAARSILYRVDPGSVNFTTLTVPLVGRSRALQLFAITAGGPGRRFEPKPGAHVVRVRPGRALDSTRQAPVSNALTVSLRSPIEIDTLSQSVSFPPSRNTPLREYRFASGPPDYQAFIRKVLARPQYPASAPLLITSQALEVLEPIPLYYLRVTRRADAPNPTSTTLTNRYLYLVRASDQLIGSVGLDVYPTNWSEGAGSLGLNSYPIGSVFSSFFSAGGNADRLYRTLQQLAQMEQVRGGNYEPRGVQVFGMRGGLPFPVYWLHSTSGRPDLFYRDPEPGFRGATKVESEKLYTAEEFLKAASTLPVTPRYDEAWAIRIASVCAKAAWPTTRNPLIYEQAMGEIGVRGQDLEGVKRIGWYVYFPERVDPQVRRDHTGATFFVDETNGACRLVPQG